MASPFSGSSSSHPAPMSAGFGPFTRPSSKWLVITPAPSPVSLCPLSPKLTFPCSLWLGLSGGVGFQFQAGVRGLGAGPYFHSHATLLVQSCPWGCLSWSSCPCRGGSPIWFQEDPVSMCWWNQPSKNQWHCPCANDVIQFCAKENTYLYINWARCLGGSECPSSAKWDFQFLCH